VSDTVDWGALPLEEQLLLADAQTSGGLLLAVDPGATDDLVRELEARGTPAAAMVGHTRVGAPATIPVILSGVRTAPGRYRAGAGGDARPRRITESECQTTRTFCASSPLRPGPTSNSTR